MLNLSLRSAPAQKAASLSLASTNALVLPFPPSEWTLSTMLLSSSSNCLERALRALARFKDSTVMLPECGAGTELILIVEESEVP